MRQAPYVHLRAHGISEIAEAVGAKITINGLPPWEKVHESMDHQRSSDTARRMTVLELREALRS